MSTTTSPSANGSTNDTRRGNRHGRVRNASLRTAGGSRRRIGAHERRHAGTRAGPAANAAVSRVNRAAIVLTATQGATKLRRLTWKRNASSPAALRRHPERGDEKGKNGAKGSARRKGSVSDVR